MAWDKREPNPKLDRALEILEAVRQQKAYMPPSWLALNDIVGALKIVGANLQEQREINASQRALINFLREQNARLEAENSEVRSQLEEAVGEEASSAVLLGLNKRKPTSRNLIDDAPIDDHSAAIDGHELNLDDLPAPCAATPDDDHVDLVLPKDDRPPSLLDEDDLSDRALAPAERLVLDRTPAQGAGPRRTPALEETPRNSLLDDGDLESLAARNDGKQRREVDALMAQMQRAPQQYFEDSDDEDIFTPLAGDRSAKAVTKHMEPFAEQRAARAVRPDASRAPETTKQTKRRPDIPLLGSEE